jgi:hypothetical protein
MRMAFATTTNYSETNIKAVSPDQFDQVVKAILEGKYSWACVLMLQFVGYDPAHYIPCRTYKRLIKNNRSSQALCPTSPSADLKSRRQLSISVP